MTDRDATWAEIHEWIDEIFGAGHQLTDIRPTYADLQYFRKYGRFYPEPSLHGHSRMEASKCFRNCADKMWEVNKRGLLYVQGLVTGSVGIVYPHAWLSDAAGNCIELTWDLNNYDGSVRYFGVPLTLGQLSTLQAEWGTYDWYEGAGAILEGS